MVFSRARESISHDFSMRVLLGLSLLAVLSVSLLAVAFLTATFAGAVNWIAIIGLAGATGLSFASMRAHKWRAEDQYLRATNIRGPCRAVGFLVPFESSRGWSHA